MTWEPQSKNIASVELSTGTLAVRFRSSPDKVYTYHVGDKAGEIFAAWQKFPSAGEYFARFVKRYPVKQSRLENV